MAGKVFTGGCLCGRIRYKATGKPSNGTHCHCEICRRASGAAFVSWATFRSGDFAFTGGRPARFDSSDIAFRQFCPDCGTPLTYRHDSFVDALDITTCSLDEPERFPPTHHSWLAHDLDWVKFSDSLPTFQESRPQP